MEKTNEKKKRWWKILLWVIGVLIMLALCVLLFLKYAPMFGGHADSEDAKDYANRSEEFKDGKFENPGKYTVMVDTDEKDPYTMSKKDTEPEKDLPSVKPDLDKYGSDSDDVTVTWLGHSLLLIRMHSKNIIIDPMFARRSSPVQFAGPERFSDPKVSIKELPHIDALLITHDHYDHLDEDSIKEIKDKTDNFFVPLGIEKDLEKWGIPEKKIRNFAWWEETDLDGLTIACTPARHYSVRNLMDNGETLWCSWVLKDKKHSIYESGDSGYDDHFKQIRKKYGDFDFALMDCGQYNMKWPQVHMFPEEAAKATNELGCKMIMPIHWGAFSLSEHAWDDPAERIVKAGKEKGLTVVTPGIGETFSLSEAEKYQKRWWKRIM